MSNEKKVLDAALGGITRKGIMTITKLSAEEVDSTISRLYIQDRINYSSGRWYSRVSRK